MSDKKENPSHYADPKALRSPGLEPVIRSYGRKHGKRLSARREALLSSLLPRVRVPVCEDNPPSDPLDLDGLFGRKTERVWFEIGFGAGEHVAEQATRNPDVGFIACEPFVNGVAKLLSLIEEQDIKNVRIFDGDARAVLDALPDGCLDRVYILHPDPWPKARHWKRRIFSAPTLDGLARVMKPGALLRFASDHMGYVAFALEAGLCHPDFEWTARGPEDWRGRPDDWVATRYEVKARVSGIAPALLEFQRGG